MSKFVLVIGAGQAGLATGYHLRKAGIPFEIVDAAGRVGDSWRNRYLSLTLFTPRQFSALPGASLVGNRELYPSRDEFADYLESYAATFDLPVRLSSRVISLTRGERFEAQLESGESISATHVVIATGAFQEPVVPSIASNFAHEVVQLTSSSYREPSQVPDGPVLVVGDGASGRDIAAELASTRPTMLAAGKPRKLFPERFLGKSIWWWLYWSGLMRAPADSRIGQLMQRADPFPDRERNLDSLAHKGVRVRSRLAGAVGATAKFADGDEAEIASVIWAVGYRDDTSWVKIPAVKNPDGSFAHVNGASPVPNLFFVGRPWQRNRASALIMGAGPDAESVVKLISEST
jgi:putative flavoprotein involved in K+ transport